MELMFLKSSLITVHIRLFNFILQGPSRTHNSRFESRHHISTRNRNASRQFRFRTKRRPPFYGGKSVSKFNLALIVVIFYPFVPFPQLFFTDPAFSRNHYWPQSSWTGFATLTLVIDQFSLEISDPRVYLI